MIIDSPIISGSYSASGSLNQFGNVVISGSLTVTGSIIGTASFASTASYLSGYVSPFPFTGSAIISGSLDVTGSLKVTGSITSTGTLTAQTLVVQTVSSSVIYSSGSNVFGNSLANTQILTGSVSITGSLAVNGSNAVLTNQTSSMSASYAVSASYASTSTSASFATSASSAVTASYWSGSINNVLSASYALTASYSANVPITASYANNANSASYAATASFVTTAQTASFVTTAQTASYVLNAVSSSFATSASQALTASYLSGYVSPFPFTGSAIISGSLGVTGSFKVTNLSGSGVRYLVADESGSITAQSASAALKSTQAFTSTAGQTTFSVTNGYSTGYVDVFINGSKLSTAEFTDTSGTNIVLATGSFVNDTVEVVKYTPAAGVTNNVLRQLTTFTASAGQTVFSASYTPGLLDIYYNGSRLSPADYTANNGTFFTLATGSAANDILDVLVYSYQVGAFSGIGGVGTAGQVAYFGTTSSITGSPNFTISGSTMLITGSLTVSGSGTFTNIGPAVFSGSLTSTAGFTGSFSGTATSASYASNADLLDGLDSTVFAITGSNTFTGIQTINSNLVVTGSITAQTLVVQTITSSVDFVTGSTRFGSLSTNTHQFTGSILISGSSTAFRVNASDLFVSSSGQVGIGTITPAYNLDVTGTGRFTGAITGGSTLTTTGDITISNSIANLRLFITNTTATTGRSWYFNSYSNGNLYVGNTTASDIFNFSSTGAATFSSALSATAGTFSSTLKSTGGDLRSIGTAADAVATGPYITISDSSTSKQMLHQLNASFGEDIWSFNGTSWTKAYTLTTAGAATFSSTVDATQGNFTSAPSIGGYQVKGVSNSSGNTSYGGVLVINSTGKGGYLTCGDNSSTTWYGGQAGYVTLAGTAGAAMKFRVNADDTAGLTIATTGAATFSSSVTATSFGGAFSITATGAGANGISDGPFIRYVNTTNSYQFLKQLNSATGEDTWYYNGSAWTKVGNTNASSGVYTALSDINKKKDFEASTIGLNAILGLKPTLYRMKNEDETISKHLGLIAQEVKDYIPQAYVEQDDFIGLQDRPIIAALVKAIQEQQTLITTLQEKLERNNIN